MARHIGADCAGILAAAFGERAIAIAFAQFGPFGFGMAEQE